MSEKHAQFSTHPYFQKRWTSVGKKLSFSSTSPAEVAQWRPKLITKLKKLTGYDTMLPSDLESRITEEVVFDGYVRQRVEILTEPSVIMPLYVLIPRHASPPYAAVITPHGHSSGGKLAVAGCRELPEIAETIDEHNYDYGVQFARVGFITFCPDARGFGERQEDAARDSILNSSCQWINNMAFPLGQTVTGMWTWDVHRLIDYVQTRQDCIPDRIGCAGLSGGGLQTLWASALDERIKCAVISGYLYGYKESLLDLHTNCSCLRPAPVRIRRYGRYCRVDCSASPAGGDRDARRVKRCQRRGQCAVTNTHHPQSVSPTGF